MRKIVSLLLLSSTLLLQSCFDIIEQLFIKNDGSGNLQLVLNMSKSKTRLNSIVKMKTVNGHNVPSKQEITQKVADIENTIKKTSGISNVKTTLDFDNYILTFNCSFTNVSSLNNAVKNIGEKEKSRQPGIDRNYDYDIAAKVFSRLNKTSLNKEYEKLSSADREVFATANYTGIFRFENDIAGSSNKDAKLSANKKAVMLKLNALDIINGKKSIENKITLSK